MSLFSIPLILFPKTFPSKSPLGLVCHIHIFPHYRRNELCCLGLVFVIDNIIVVVGSTHGVELGQLHNIMVTSFFSLWCSCHMNIQEVFFVLRTCFHPSIIKTIHTLIPHNYVFQLCFCHMVSRPLWIILLLLGL
jgi:hypothetical protein